MTGTMAAAASSPTLWYLSRASGLVLMMLFSIVIVLGTATRLGSAPSRWPRFAIAELHRTFSLFAVALLVLHVVTAILDPYVKIGWAATVLPLASPYRPVALGFGALAVDLAGAVLVTSLARRHLSHRSWRIVHWLAYLAWPAAFVHSVTAGNDMSIWWVAMVECICGALVATAVGARLMAAVGLRRAATPAGRVIGAEPRRSAR
jgi:methionine sulfoxide reductase heme-binding subunit